MNPQYPDNSHATPPASSGGGPQPAGGWRIWSRKKMIGAVAVLVVIVAAILMLTVGKDMFSGGGQDEASLYVKRAGYENVNEVIGDPTALISKSGSKIVQYAGSDVVQPCTLITIQDVRSAGLKVAASQLPGIVQRFYFDGESPATFAKAPNDFSLPILDDSNACQYSLEDKGSVRITVDQQEYVSEKAINRELEKGYNKIADVEGLSTYQRTASAEDPNTAYFLSAKGAIVELQINTPDKVAEEKILKLLAQRLKSSSSTPTPIEEFTYNSPVFEASVTNACGLITPNSFKEVFGIDSGPLVEEKLATAVGVIADGADNTAPTNKYNFVSRDCKRRSPDPSATAKTLTIETDTYETAEGAKALFKYSKSGTLTSDLEEVSGVGEEAYFANTAGMDNALVVRQGRVVVHLGYYIPEGDANTDPAERIRILTPIGKSVAGKLAGD